MNDTNDLKVLRHSAAHLAAHAVLELFPGTKLTIGPATEEGFFYDILPVHNLKEEDLALIEKRMHEISQRNLPIEHKEISKEEARVLFKDNPFKMELIEQIPGDTVGLSAQGDFIDLCRGGHVDRTGDIKYFKLRVFQVPIGVLTEIIRHCSVFTGLRFLPNKICLILKSKEKRFSSTITGVLVSNLIIFLFMKKG